MYCKTGPAIGPEGRGHVHAVHCPPAAGACCPTGQSHIAHEALSDVSLGGALLPWAIVGGAAYLLWRGIKASERGKGML